jgi:colicin import membrane protein
MARRLALPPGDRSSDGFVAFLLSVLLHGGIIAALAFGAYFIQTPPHEEVLAIEAELPSMRTAAPKTEPQPIPVPPPAPPSPSPEEVAAQEQAKEQEVQKQAAEQKEREEAAARAEQEQQQKAEAARVAQEKAAEEAAEAKADAERKAKEAAEAQKKAEADKKRQADLKKQLDAEEQAVKAEAERKQREAELKRSLEQEDQESAAARDRANELTASWVSAISARIHRAWNKPPAVSADLKCELHVTQQPGGKVTAATLGACNGDEATKQSILSAVYGASPLPPPPDPSVFQPNLFIIFKP